MTRWLGALLLALVPFTGIAMSSHYGGPLLNPRFQPPYPLDTLDSPMLVDDSRPCPRAVLLRVLMQVSSLGTVDEAWLLKPSANASLNNEALRLGRSMRFEPAIVDWEPRPHTTARKLRLREGPCFERLPD